MTPRIFKWLRRDKPPQPPRIRRTDPDSLGIDHSTCEVTESVTNPCKFPIPPSLESSHERHGHKLSVSSPPANPQPQTGFFKLPIEIRRKIYAEVLGSRRVHIDYDFSFPTGWGNTNKRKRQWRCWHCVCADGDSFIEDDFLHDKCPRTLGEEPTDERIRDGRVDARTCKIRGAGWLRSCRRLYIEAIPVIYGTNTFITGYNLDTPFRMARILPASQRSLITALDIRFGVAMKSAVPPGFTEGWETVYPALFHMLQHGYPNSRELRLTIGMVSIEFRTRRMTVEDIDRFLGPWKSLVTSRHWKMLELRVSESWYPTLRPRAERQEGYKLSTIQDLLTPHDPIGCIAL